MKPEKIQFRNQVDSLLKTHLKSMSDSINNIFEGYIYQKSATKDMDSRRIAQTLKNDICAKDRLGLPTTGKDIGNHVKLINKFNVNQVYNEYLELTDRKENLFSAILNEIGLSTEEREGYVKHIFYAMLDEKKSSGVYTDDLKRDFDTELKKKGTISSKFINALTRRLFKRAQRQNTGKLPDRQNGKIDKDFKQGQVGDCWCLAAIKSLAMSPKGLQILNDSIKVLPDMSVEVTLKGVGRTYHISRAELNNSKELATGDADVRALEIAMDRYIKEEGGINNGVDLKGNHAYVAYFALTGEGDRNWFSNRYGRLTERFFTDSQINNFNNPNHIAVVSSTNGSPTEAVCDGKKVRLITNHAYSVKGADKNNVYLINPHDTSKVITVSRKEFKEFFNQVDEFDL